MHFIEQWKPIVNVDETMFNQCRLHSEKISSVKRAILHCHAQEGKCTTCTNSQRKIVVEVAELERFYGKLNMLPQEQHETTKIRPDVTEADMQNVTDVLKKYLADTKAELKDAKAREKELLTLLKIEQEKTRLLMLPGSIKKTSRFSFWKYFR
ncbi:hypothetical protein F4212_10950 [Candidatus Poribacteria bacterium]|nr:hypothetical protein [Candidatus Poribacteria bacterium]